jgi:hypothetical protein
VIQELRGAFQHFVNEGRLAAISYYGLSDQPGKEAGVRCLITAFSSHNLRCLV